MISKAPGADCENCPLKDQPIAHTQGPENSEVILVSRSPGYHEAMNGVPFSGPSGKVLDFMLKQQGVDRKDIRVTNTVLCAPPAGRLPKEAIKACSGRLRRELSSATLVIAAGSEAVNEVLGRGSVTNARGYTHDRVLDGVQQRIIATNNPALVLYDDSTFPNIRKDFKLAFHPRPVPVMSEVNLVDDVDTAKGFIDELLRKPPTGGLVAADIESRGGLNQFAELVTFQLSIDSKQATVFGIHVTSDEDWIDNYLKPFLLSKDLKFIWHNGKFDTKVLRGAYNIEARVDHDTMLLSYALDERPGVHSLEYILMDELAWPSYEPDTVKRFKKSGIIEDYAALWKYAGYDACGTRQIFDLLSERAIEQDVWDDPYVNHYLPKAELLSRIEANGVIYNVDAAADIYEKDIRPELGQLERELQDISDRPLLNPNSPVQMKEIVYDTWGLKHAQQSRPDKETSFDAEAREIILLGEFTTKLGRMKQPDRELRRNVLKFTKKHDRFKKLGKMGSTYILSLIEKAESNYEHRIYTDFLLHGAESGRISSRRPNLQNVARDKENLPSIRSLFHASEGRVIVNADYSQAELRCIAVFSGDTVLQAIYSDRTRSFHKETARKFYGEGYTPEEYVKSKNINFGIFFGQSAFAFSQMYHMPQREAQDYINLMWNTFPQVKEWVKQVHLDVRKVGTLINPFGRRRRFYLITDENRDHAEKEAVNFYSQSTASDITLEAADRIQQEIDPKRAAIIILVHDSIVGDVQYEYLEEYSTIAAQVMESVPKSRLNWDIPFTVDIGHGPSWGEVK